MTEILNIPTTKKFFTKKKIIWTVIILLVFLGIGYFVYKGKDNSKNILTETTKKLNLRQTVLATGQVTSNTNLDLSFKIGGIVEAVNAKEGGKVKKGEVLANVGQRDQIASLTSARGSLASANANYRKVLDGASNEEVAVAQRAVDSSQVTLESAKLSLSNTVQQQETAVKNAYSTLLNSTITAIPAPNNLGSAVVTVSGAYSGPEQGSYKISATNTGLGQRFQSSGLESSEGDVKSSPVPLGKKGLSIQFSGNVFNTDYWTITLPNTSASNYVSNYNAYQAALKSQSTSVDSAQSQVNSAQSSLAQAKANLDLKRAQARPAELEAAQAQILSAQGQVQSAASALENTVIRAPSDGTITQVNVKVGEQASALKAVLVLQDITNLHVEANISEANIAAVKPSQVVDFTFDALGPDRHFKGTVQIINPASTVVSGVVNYKVTANLDNLPEIKPGMTANMSVLVAEKSGVLAIPVRAVISHDNKKFARIITDQKKKTYKEKEITTGLEADGGLTEVTSGLSEGDEVVSFIKK